MTATNMTLKKRALAQLKGNWTQPVLLALVFLLISGAAQSLPILGLLAPLATVPLEFGCRTAFLQFYRGEKDNVVHKLFDPFRNYWRILSTGILMSVYIMLWSLLLFVPGIIKALSYSMTPLVMMDNLGLKNNAAIKLSMAIMTGNKMKLFILYLSFIGWSLLACLTLGIGFLWLIPYMNVALSAFYEEAKAEYESKNLAPGYAPALT